MKKTTKRLLSVILAVVIIALGIGTYYMVPLLTMRPAETGRVLDTDIYALKNNNSTIFFFKTEDGYIMIDAGANQNIIDESVKPEYGQLVKNMGINTADVKWILITHTDGDHIASLALFQNAKIYMSEDVDRSGSGRNTVPSNIENDEVVFLKNNQELLCNETIVKCIKAPGHTDGSMVYLIDRQYLFTGDAFKVVNGKVGVHPFTTNKALAEETIKNLEETINGSSLILTSHYGYYEKLEF